jgi:DNA polymerase III subunit delta
MASAAAVDSGAVAGLKPLYLVSGDDGAKIDAWRTRVRTRAEAEGGPGACESFDGRGDGPDAVAAALLSLTFAAGTRYVLADGVEAWKAGDLEPLERALAEPVPDTVLVLIARGKPVQRLCKLVEGAGGEHREYAAPKAWQLPKWVAERAREQGLALDGEAAKALVAAVGTSQQRLAREVEKLALTAHPGGRLSAEEVAELASGVTVPQVYDLADALVAGDPRATLALAERLRAAEERAGRLMWPIVRRLREVHRAAELLDAGVPEGEVGGKLKQPPWLAKRTVQRAAKADRDALERAICTFADLEVELRGGDLDEESAFSLALARAAGA